MIAIIGGSGFYQFLEKVEEVAVETPYGAPSDKLTIGECAGKKIVFLPRHGRQHQYPPHRIPYRVNLYALKQLGVTRILAAAAVGSLQAQIKPGDFVICNQFIDRTTNRLDTFFDGPPEKVVHISMADPFCSQLREQAIQCCEQLRIPFHPKGTVVVIQGPRFSTRQESRWFSQMGWDVVNMTTYPEVVLARELEICYVNIALVTDYDVGIEGQADIKPVTAETVKQIFQQNIERVKQLFQLLIEQIPEQRDCPCQHALQDAAIG